MKRKGMLKALIGIICIALFTGVFVDKSVAWWPWGKEEKKVLNFGLMPAEDPEKILASFRPMLDHIAQVTGMEIKPFIATDYAGVIEAMRVGKIDIAWFGPFSYILAAERANAVAIAKGMDKRGNTTYRSIIITHNKSGIKTLNDLKGKTIAFADPASTSGHLVPRYMMEKAGIDTERDFENIVFTGGHEAVGLSVKNRHVDAGGMGEMRLQGMIDKGVVDKDEIIILATSDPIPNSPIAVRKDMDPEMKKQITQAILELHEHLGEEKMMGWHKVIKYVEARDEDYDVIRDIARILEIK